MPAVFPWAFVPAAMKNFTSEKKSAISPWKPAPPLISGPIYLIRNKLRRAVSKTEMLEHLARSRKRGW